MKSQKDASKQNPLDPKHIPPQIRYHPSIQVEGGGASGKTISQTRSSHTQRSRADASHLPQTRTESKAVHENQDTKRACSSGSHHDDGGPEPDKDLNPAGGGTPPRPEQVPLDVKVLLDRCLLEKVEVLTRGQRTNPDWFAWRKNRITASVAHRIAHCRFVNGKNKAPPLSYLSAVTGEGPRVQTRAMSWGIQMEAQVVGRYQTLKTEALGRPVSVLDCGLFIDAQRPWLAASPDGIVTDSQTGQWLLCLEVKCPYKHRHRRVEDACRDDPAFCLQIQDQDGPGQPPVYHLKTSHSYFTQIQCQLAVTGLRQADLVVFTLEETAVVPVTFDPKLWDETVSKLEVFYRNAVLPLIKQKMEPDAAAAAWRPEL